MRLLCKLLLISYDEKQILSRNLNSQVHIPPSAMLDGVHAQHFYGTGVVVHHSESLGLVAVDRNTVAIAVSDVMLSFAAYPVEIPAEVLL